MAGLVAYRPEDRLVLRKWFDVIVSGASGRSVSRHLVFVISELIFLQSVPPIWETTKTFWAWIDAQPFAIPKDDNGDLTPLSERTPWWEYMVRWFLKNYGELSLV